MCGYFQSFVSVCSAHAQQVLSFCGVNAEDPRRLNATRRLRILLERWRSLRSRKLGGLTRTPNVPKGFTLDQYLARATPWRSAWTVVKLLYPLRFDATLSPGAESLGRFCATVRNIEDQRNVSPLCSAFFHRLGATEGGTSKCPGCQEEVSLSIRRSACEKRYQKWLRDSIDDSLEVLDEGPKVDRDP